VHGEVLHKIERLGGRVIGDGRNELITVNGEFTCSTSSHIVCQSYIYKTSMIPFPVQRRGRGGDHERCSSNTEPPAAGSAPPLAPRVRRIIPRSSATVVDCRAALDGQRDARNVREVVACALADPATGLRRLGEPKRGGIEPLHRSPELTIVNVLWPAGQVIMPHNHAPDRRNSCLWR
jgi:hypothetical protein